MAGHRPNGRAARHCNENLRQPDACRRRGPKKKAHGSDHGLFKLRRQERLLQLAGNAAEGRVEVGAEGVDRDVATEMPAAIRPYSIAVAPLSTADTYRRSVAAGRIVPTKSALTFADGMAVPARRDGTRSNSATGGGFGPPWPVRKSRA